MIRQVEEPSVARLLHFGGTGKMSGLDVVIPVGIVKENGTSKACAPSSYFAVPDLRVLLALVKAAKDLDASFHLGTVFSHDIFSPEAAKRGLQAGTVLGAVSVCDEAF